jgi:hypothetical protein
LHSSKLLGTLSIFLVILLVAPTLASPVSAWFVREDPLKSALASIASEPLGTAPLTLRRQAYEIIRTIPGMEGAEADFSAFADRARLMSAEPLEEDYELIRGLLMLVRSPRTDPAAKDAAALSISLLLRAGRHAALIVLSDGELVANGTGKSATERALGSARSDYVRAMEWLGRGNAEHAARLLASSLASSLKALFLMGVSYYPDADSEGDGLPDIVELRAGSSPFSADTDGDGMGDYYEVFSLIPWCMPGTPDTENNGVPDGEEDTDEDGFTNIEEMMAGTNPLLAGDYPGLAFTFSAPDPLALGSPGDGMRVLLDLFHGEWDGASVEGMALPIDILGFLESYGFTVDAYTHLPLDNIDLSPYAALLIVSPWLPFTAGELSAIEAFVANGGGLLVSCDTQMTTLNQAPNQVAGLFGMRFRSEWYAFESIVAPTHPIMAGLSDGDLFQPFMLFDAAIERYPANATVLTGESYVPWPSMVAMEYGAGRMIAGPNNGLCQPWGKGIDADAYYARDVPNVLLARAVEWLAKGSVTPPPTPVGYDTDHDGLADAVEAPGIVDQFGMLLMTDPHAGDTDGDGLWDGDEAGVWNGAYWVTASNPLLNDTDWDGVEDFVELDELVGTDPMARDTDMDGLWDGEELYTYGTDPLNWDTDGDGDGDQNEVAWGMDPLLYNERWDMLAAVHEFTLGLVAGEFAMDDHGNMPFFSGLLAGGAVSLVPVVGWLAGFLIDARDFLAALCREDWTALGINSLALLPYVGDAADIVGTVARFVAKHPEVASSVGIFMARMDWASGAAKIAAVRASVGDAVVDGLVAKGLSEAKVLKLARGGVDLAKVDERFAPLFKKYPGMKAFFEGVGVEELDDGTMILKGNTLTLNIKRLGVEKNPNTVAVMLGAIEGAHTQVAMVNAKVAEGWRVISKAEHYCAQGYDAVMEKGGIIRLMEAKAGDIVPVKQCKNLFFIDREKNIFFNDHYFFKKIKNDRTLRDAFNEGRLQIEVFINNPNCAKSIDRIRDTIGVGPTEKIFVTYVNDYGFEKLVEVIFTGVLI